MKGTMKRMPGVRVRWYSPSRSITMVSACWMTFRPRTMTTATSAARTNRTMVPILNSIGCASSRWFSDAFDDGRQARQFQHADQFALPQRIALRAARGKEVALYAHAGAAAVFLDDELGVAV